MSVAATSLDIFRAKGVPHRRMEDWKYTDLRSVVDAETVERATGVVMSVTTPSQIQQVFLDYEDLPEWASRRAGSLSALGAMPAAADAFEANGVALRVPSKTLVSEALRLDFEADGQGRVILVVERNASLTLIETHHSYDEGLRNIALYVTVEEGARLTHILRAPFSKSLVVVENTTVHLEGGAQYFAHIVGQGAKLSRFEFDIRLKGEGAEADLSGVSVLGDHAHADITTHIDHAVPNTTSRQLFKKIVGGHARGIYQGKITVREGAIGSDSRQTAKALLMSTHAEADLKPQLEIFADDVKCAHGAAVGDLDQDSLFYLRARGIPESEARAMLVRAFLQEAIDKIEDEGIRASATEFVEAGLISAMKDTP